MRNGTPAAGAIVAPTHRVQMTTLCAPKRLLDAGQRLMQSNADGDVVDLSPAALHAMHELLGLGLDDTLARLEQLEHGQCLAVYGRPPTDQEVEVLATEMDRCGLVKHAQSMRLNQAVAGGMDLDHLPAPVIGDADNVFCPMPIPSFRTHQEDQDVAAGGQGFALLLAVALCMALAALVIALVGVVIGGDA